MLRATPARGAPLAFAAALVVIAACSTSPCRRVLTAEELEAETGRTLQPGVEVRTEEGCALFYAEAGRAPRVREPVAELEVTRRDARYEQWRESLGERAFDRVDVLRREGVEGRIALAPTPAAAVPSGAGAAAAQREAEVAEALFRHEDSASAAATESPAPTHHEAVVRRGAVGARLRVHARVMDPRAFAALVEARVLPRL